MSDQSQGPGWWQASDGKWYPPEQAPGGGAQDPASGGGGQLSGGSPGQAVSVGDAFNWAWQKFQQNLGPIVIVAVLWVAVTAIIYLIWNFAVIASLTGVDCVTNPRTGFVECDAGAGFFMSMILLVVGVLLSWLISSFFQLAIIRGGLMLTRGETLDVGKLLSFDQFAPFLLGTLLVGIGVSIGYALCIIPGIIVMFFSFFYGYFIVDKNQSPVDAIKSSFQLVNSNIGSVVIFFLGVMAAYVIGALLCGIGLLVTMPVAMIATAYVYKRMQGEPVAA